MRKKIDPVVDEAIETLNMKDGPSRRRLLEGAGLFSATAAASALIAACSSSSSSSASSTSTAKAAAGNFPTTPKWQFTFVNHVTDNSFFTPTQYGFADAAAILGIPTPHWTGALSTQPTVPTMLSAFNDAVTAGSPGIATTVVAATSFISPINSALAAGVPVVTYNANGSSSSPTNGLAYVGQDLLASGQEVGTRLASLMKKGDTAVGIIAQPGALNIQPRLDGATTALEAAGMTVLFGNKGFDGGASASQEATAVPEFIQSHGSKIQGIFAVDGGDTALLGTSLQKYGLVGKVAAGGFDLEPQTLTAIST
jgi:simple sugar transport system substrate-binding protein